MPHAWQRTDSMRATSVTLGMPNGQTRRHVRQAAHLSTNTSAPLPQFMHRRGFVARRLAIIVVRLPSKSVSALGRLGGHLVAVDLQHFFGRLRGDLIDGRRQGVVDVDVAPAEERSIAVAARLPDAHASTG